MKVGDLVTNRFQKADGIGVCVGIVDEVMVNIYWSKFKVTRRIHYHRLEVINESR